MTTHKTSRFGAIRIAWLRFLDRVKPRPGIGGTSPRIATASPAEAERIEQILLRARSVLDIPCECTGNPPTYEYRRDKRQHCMWCDGLREPSCNHEWLYHDRQPGEDYTGYCEHCPKCGELRQIVQ